MRLIPLKLRAVYTLEEISVHSRCQILMRHHTENCRATVRSREGRKFVSLYLMLTESSFCRVPE